MSSAVSTKKAKNKAISSFVAPSIPPEVAGSIRAKQLSSVTGLVPAIMMAQLINGAVVLLAFWSSGAEGLLGIWATALCLICGVTMLGSVQAKATIEKKTRSQRSMDNMARRSAFLGLLWGVVPIIVVPYSDPLGHMVLGIVMSAMGFAGGFLLGRIPQAAYAFLVPLMMGHIIGLQIVGTPIYDLISILTLVYTFILVVCVQWSHARYVEQLLGEAALIEQEQVISLLLRDFEETTSDWLWQTDEDGTLLGLQEGLQGNKRQYEIMRNGSELLELFEDCDGKAILETSLRRRTSFRDLVMPVAKAEGEVWWLLTGKPVFENGFFAGFRGVASDVTATKVSEDRIAHLAHYDDLTGLPNRVTMLERLEKEVRAPTEAGSQRALLWLDLDNFKWVNDTLGHPAGDALLRMVADRLHEHCDPSDTIARLGGDEFAVSITRKGGRLEIETFVEKLSRALAKPYNLMGAAAKCSASIGVRIFDNTLTDASSLLKHADLALYKSKNNGRARWCVFSNDLEDEAQRRRVVEHDLQRAIENNELVIHFQPQVDAKSRELIGCEALLRWVHPTKGLIYPSEFIETAEDCGLITRLGDWVIRAALENAKHFPEHVRIAVNISPLQIHSANLFPTIVHALASNGINPSRLDLEITESVLMTDTNFTIDRLHQLKDLGVRISLDDFGTGFSSLSYLRKFPFDKIKIDKSFISDMETSEDSRAITVATLGLAKALGLRCTAEGVETEFQSRFLSEHGCDELQGFVISRAQPVEKLQFYVDMETTIQERVPVIGGHILAGPALVAVNDDAGKAPKVSEKKQSEAS